MGQVDGAPANSDDDGAEDDRPAGCGWSIPVVAGLLTIGLLVAGFPLLCVVAYWNFP